MSVAAITEKGGEVLFKKDEVLITKNGSVILKGCKEKQGLYITDIRYQVVLQGKEALLAKNKTLLRPGTKRLVT